MIDVALIASVRKHTLVSTLASPSCVTAQGKGLWVLMQDGLVARQGSA